MFDKVTGKVVAVVPTGASPAGMVLNPVLRRAYGPRMLRPEKVSDCVLDFCLLNSTFMRAFPVL